MESENLDDQEEARLVDEENNKEEPKCKKMLSFRSRRGAIDAVIKPTGNLHKFYIDFLTL